MKRLLSLLLLAVPFVLAEDPGKHLFILSGQSNMAGLDPKASFTPAVEAAFGKENVIVVKSAKGGQPIRRWDTEWKPAEGDKPVGDGLLYDAMMQATKAAVKDSRLTSVTFLWMQGERDAKEKHAAVYADSFKRIIAHVAKDLGHENVHVVIGRLSDARMQSPEWIKVRDIHVELADSFSHGAWVDTDDLNDGINRNGKKISNDVHYSADGYITFGQRLADKSIALLKK